MISAVFLVSYLSPEVYRDYLLNLGDLALKFFIPAIFPTVFLIAMLLETGCVQDLCQRFPRFGNLVMAAILAFGGTPTLLSVWAQLELEPGECDRLAARYVAPSFSFIFFLFKPLVGPTYALLDALGFFLIPLLLQIFFPLHLAFRPRPEGEYKLVASAQNCAFGALKGLYNLLVMIALVGSLKPIVSRLDQPLAVGLIQGLLEYTSGSLELVKLSGLGPAAALAFVLNFNGLSSYLAVKKIDPRLRLGRCTAVRLVLSALALLPLVLLIFEGFQHA